jgi:hypothetical protein
MDKLIYEHNGRVRKANRKPRAKQPPIEQPLVQPPVEQPKDDDDNDSVNTEELDKLNAEYKGNTKPAKQPVDKVQCPDCGKEVSAKTMKYSHKKYCIKPVVEPEPAKDLQTNAVKVDATPKKAKAKQEKKPVPEAKPQEPEKEEEGFATGQHQAQVYSTHQLLDMQRKGRQLMRKDRFQSLFKKAV